MINHPQHYNMPGKKECIEQMLEDYGAEVTITFCLTSAFKYLYRMGNKPDNPAIKDLNKAIWYFNYARKCVNEYQIEMLGALIKLYDDIQWDLALKGKLNEIDKETD